MPSVAKKNASRSVLLCILAAWVSMTLAIYKRRTTLVEPTMRVLRVIERKRPTCWLGNCARTEVMFLSYNPINLRIFFSTAAGILPEIDAITSCSSRSGRLGSLRDDMNFSMTSRSLGALYGSGRQ